MVQKREGGEPKFSPLFWVACEMGFLKNRFCRCSAGGLSYVNSGCVNLEVSPFAGRRFASVKQSMSGGMIMGEESVPCGSPGMDFALHW